MTRSPDYPGQVEPVWAWWSRGEPEDGLLGFHTKEDLDGFAAGGLGPFRRRMSTCGRTISQTKDWSDLVNEAKEIIKENK